MSIVRKTIWALIVCMCVWRVGYSQTASRILISSITPSISTGQDYSPWLNDDMTRLITNVWTSANMQYVDVKIKLQSKASVSKLSLYDYEGIFTDHPASIYAVNGSTRTLIGTFTGPNYMVWDDINLTTPVVADTIIVRKYANELPMKIKIYGVPVASSMPPLATPITGWMQVCPGRTTSLGNTNWGGNWTSANTAVATIGLTTGVVTGVSAGTATISYVYAGQLATATVTVNPAVPAAAAISGASSVCPGSTTTMSSTAACSWSSSAPAVATVNTSGVVTGVAAGTANITASVSNGCGTSVSTKPVTVGGASTASAGTISGASTVCRGTTTTLTSSVAGGTWSSSTTGVATVSATGVVTGVAAGSATISYTVASSCGTAVAVKTITVSNAASAGVVSGAATVCSGATTSLVTTVSGGTWSSSAAGVATVSSAGVVTGVAAGTATISYTVSNTCGTAVATKTISVSATSAASAGTISGAASVCQGATTTFTNAVTGGTWSSSATGVATVTSAGVVTGVAAGTATISYTVAGTCGSSVATKSITVNGPASAGTISGSSSLCVGATTTMTNSVTGGTWSSSAAGVATVSSTGVVTGVAAGSATISYNVAGSCGTAVATKAITVSATASAGTISGASSLTAGTTTTLTSSVTGGTWSSSASGVATVSSTGVVTGVAAGSATITYTVGGSCGSASATKAITVTAATTGGGGGSTGGGTLTYGLIPMDGKRWYQLNNCSNGLSGLHDGNLTTAVNTGYGKILSNFDAYYPVMPGETINIDSIKFYDGPGSNETAPFTLYYIDSAWHKVQIAQFLGTQLNRWVGPNASAPSSYAIATPARNVRYLVINSSSQYPYEMQVYGSYHAPNSIPAAPAKEIKLKQQLGVNGFEWNFLNPSNPLTIDGTRLNAAKSFTGLRHYLDWEKLEPNSGGYTFNPSHSGGWNLDTMYIACKASGIEVLADLKTIPAWLQATYASTDRDNENVPVSTAGADFSNPNSYLRQAKVAFQFAARYGSNTSVSSSLLSVDASTRWGGDPANVVRKGLNLVKYMECDNERDKWWKGRKAYQTGREYAANMSAFYDGHKNTMGPGVGVKNADPNMQVVMGGVAMPTTDFLRGMIDWCKENRGYKSDGSVNVCWDVVNYHIYTDDGGSMQGGGSRGASPEAGHADTFATRFVSAAHMYLGDMPVWITETGYDINSGSPLRAIPIGAKSALQTQADWILRTSLLNARMGIERTFFYEMYDDNLSSATQFASSGLINSDKTRKPAADFLLQANRLMGEYVYKETISTNPLVDRYELGGQSIYVLVKPSENGSSMSYTLPISSGSSVKIYNPTVGRDTMSVSTSSVSGGSITLTVTETPMFVKPVTTGGKEAPAAADAPNTIVDRSEITTYPNPTSGNVNLSIDNDKDGDVNVTVYTETGRVCKTYMFTKSSGKFTQSFDLSGLPNGMYLMEINQKNEKTLKKIIKVN